MLNLGPLLRKELVVVSRQRRTFWLRAGALALLSLLMIPLLIQLVILAQRTFSVKSVAEVLFQIFVWTQFALLVMAAPAFSAGAISYERRLGTIDLLKLAAIRAPTLTLGKFLGAAALPFLLVLSEVPFLFIWTLFGGISAEKIFAALGLSVSITILLIAVGLFTSAITQTAGIAMVISYVIGILYVFGGVWAPPLVGGWISEWLIPVALARSLSSTAVTAFPWWKAAGAAIGGGTLLATVSGLFLVQPPSVTWVLDRTSVGSKANRKSRRVWDHPILWREMYCGGGKRVTRFLNVVTVLSIGCLVGASVTNDDDLRWTLGALTLALPPIAGGVLGAITVSLEKEGRSIAALLLMPSSATQVVLGKFAGACSRTLPLAVIPFLLGFVRLELGWMFASLGSLLVATLMIATGVLFSTIFAKTAVSVAVTFAGVVMYSFCGCYQVALFPLFMGPNARGSDGMTVAVVFFIAAGIYSVIISTVLAIAIGMFETRARDAVTL